MRKRLTRRNLAERLLEVLMIASLVVVGGSVVSILVTITIKGARALSWDMISQVPKGGYYLGKEGGILNAIVGSLYLAGGGTILALAIGLPIALFLRLYIQESRWAGWVRLALDALWGIPSIVYGAFGFTLMAALHLRSSLLAGILVLTLVELPIMTRAMDEVMRMLPAELEEASYALGATRIETAVKVVVRQTLPGILTAVLVAFGRGIGDAASVLFTAGYTDNMPTSLLRPAASLPLAIFFQLGTPYPEVQERAYAAALILTVIILFVSLGSRWLTQRASRHVVK